MTALRDMAIFCLGAGSLLLASAGAKVAIDSRAHYLEAEALRARAQRTVDSRDLLAASEAYARAVKSYVPFASHGQRALQRMLEIGDQLSAAGETDKARRVWLEGARQAAELALIYDPYARQGRELRERASRPRRAGQGGST